MGEGRLMRAHLVDIQIELSGLPIETFMLGQGIQFFEEIERSRDLARCIVVRNGLALALEKLYGGYERVMAMIATNIDRHSVTPNVDDLDRVLLKRISHAYPGVRGPVISAPTFGVLDDLRCFRQEIRESRSMGLSPDDLRRHAAQASLVCQVFHTEVTAFIASMNEPALPEDSPAP